MKKSKKQITYEFGKTVVKKVETTNGKRKVLKRKKI